MVTTSAPRRAAAALAVLCAAILATLAVSSPAQASAFRYWSYWQGASGQWEFAQTGPGDHTIVDKDVQGWRFAISTEELSQKPDNAPDFAALCPDLASGDAPAGQLRVAVVIDSGFVADAPQGQTPPADVVSCVTVPEGSTGNQALGAAATVSDKDGLVCALNGYPADECGAPVPDAEAEAAASAAASEQPNPAAGTASTDDAEAAGSSPVALIVGAAAVVALLVAAWFLVAARRRRTSQQPDATA